MTAAEQSDFTAPTELSDVVLNVEGRKLHFNKAYLATWSPVFRRMFFGEFRENNSLQVTLPDKKFAEIQELLRCICPIPKVKPITDENVFFLLRLADEYHMSDLLQRCGDKIKKIIESRVPSQDEHLNFSPLEALKIACEVGLGDLIEVMMPLAAKETSENLSQYHSSIPPHVLCAIYQAKYRLIEKQLESPGAVTFGLTQVSNGAHICVVCGNNSKGPHTKCALCSKQICSTKICLDSHAVNCRILPTTKVVYCNTCKAYMKLGEVIPKCKCFTLEWDKNLLDMKKIVVE